MNDLLFLKLGGSLLTDKTEKEALRRDTLARIAIEIASARATRPGLALVLGHGSGSFGHVAAANHNTRHGVHSPAEWLGFVEVSDAAARLNRYVIQALLDAGVPAIGLSPVASAQVEDGRIVYLAVQPVEAALQAGLVPVVYGDVAFDTVRGGTIISTEEIMTYLADSFRPSWFLLAGETAGVLDGQGRVVSSIHRYNLAEIQPALGGSRGTDVTGGMAAKVLSLMTLVEQRPEMSIRIFSGLEVGLLSRLLLNPTHPAGTCLRYI
jgi:isopentenyl phosphate kinase